MTRRVLLALALALARGAAPAEAATNNWQEGSGTNWNTAANWSDGVPTADDDVVIQDDGQITVDNAVSSADAPRRRRRGAAVRERDRRRWRRHAGGDGQANLLDGRVGDDALRSAGDAAVDEDRCGEGADSAQAEPADVVAPDCEAVTRVPPPPPPAGSGVLVGSIAGGTFRISQNGVVSLPIACPTGSDGCQGFVELLTAAGAPGLARTRAGRDACRTRRLPDAAPAPDACSARTRPSALRDTGCHQNVAENARF